jgi:hypothetical protein
MAPNVIEYCAAADPFAAPAPLPCGKPAGWVFADGRGVRIPLCAAHAAAASNARAMAEPGAALETLPPAAAVQPRAA